MWLANIGIAGDSDIVSATLLYYRFALADAFTNK